MNRIMSSIPHEKLYSEVEAAERLGISKPSLLRLRREGHIGHYRIGARVLYSEAAHIRPFLDACNQPPAATPEGPEPPDSQGTV